MKRKKNGTTRFQMKTESKKTIIRAIAFFGLGFGVGGTLVLVEMGAPFFPMAIALSIYCMVLFYSLQLGPARLIFNTDSKER